MALIPAKGNLRTLAAATFANTLGSGLWMAADAVFLTRSVGLSAQQVGVGFSVGGLVGLAAAVPVGSLTDRYDPRTVRALLQVTQAFITLGYVFVHSLTGFLVVVILDTTAATGNLAVRASLVAEVAGPEGRVRAFASLRAVASLGIGLGAALAATALAVDTRPAYLTLVVVDAMTFAVSAGLIMRLPSFKPLKRAVETRRAEALRDRPFVAVTFATSVMSMCRIVLSLAVPIWIVAHTSSPRVIVSAVVVINTVLSVLLSVRLSRDAETAEPAASQVRKSGWILAAGMVIFSFASGLPTAPAVLVLLAAAPVFTIGELLNSNATSGLSYALSNPALMGQYQGVGTLGTGLAETVGPLFLTSVLLSGGRLGWWVVGLMFAVTGAIVPMFTAWAVKSHAGNSPEPQIPPG